MQKADSSIKTMVQAITAAGERSPLFWWFVENHAEFKTGLAGQRIRWSVVAQEARAMGLTNRLGGSPTAKFSKTTWYRACKYVAAQQAAAAAAEPRSPTFPVPRQCDLVPPLVAKSPERQDEFSHSETRASPPHIAEKPVHVFTDAQAAGPGSDLEHKGALAVLSPHVSLSSSAPARKPEPQWTPEQTAMINAEIAKAFGELDHVDRFHKLKG